MSILRVSRQYKDRSIRWQILKKTQLLYISTKSIFLWYDLIIFSTFIKSLLTTFTEEAERCNSEPDPTRGLNNKKNVFQDPNIKLRQLSLRKCFDPYTRHHQQMLTGRLRVLHQSCVNTQTACKRNQFIISTTNKKNIRLGATVPQTDTNIDIDDCFVITKYVVLKTLKHL